MAKRTPIRGEDGFDVYAAMGYEYLGTVEVEMPEATSTATLELRFWGSPTDHLWNHRTALEFYTPLIEQQGLRVLAYGVQGIGPRGDLLVEEGS